MNRNQEITEAFVKAIVSENSRGEIEPGVVIEVDDQLEIHKWCRYPDGNWRRPQGPEGFRSEQEMQALIPGLTPPE